MSMLRIVEESGAAQRQAATLRRAKPSPARALHGALLFITLAAIAHILTVLLVPRYATRDAGSRFVISGAEGQADLIVQAPGDAQPIIDADPATAMAVCGFDLADGPIRISARSGASPLAVSVHIRGGGVLYAVTDKAAQRGVIEFTVLTQAQFEQRIANDDDGASLRELRVVSPAAQGIVLSRALVKQASDRPGAEALVKGMACGSAD